MELTTWRDAITELKRQLEKRFSLGNPVLT